MKNMKNMKKLNERLDIWFDLMLETEGFEENILKPLHDRLSYFNEDLDETDERRIRVLKYYGLLWEENIR